MALLVPPEIKQDINRYSGYLNPESKYSQKNLKGLFLTIENQKYLSKELYSLITCEKYVTDNLPDDAIYDIPTLQGTHDNPIYGYNNKSTYFNKTKYMIQNFIKSKPILDRVIFGMVECHQIPFNEDLGILNPIQQLHFVNLDFLVKSSSNLIQNPQNLMPHLGRINSDTNKYETAENDYDASSYSDGTWHPEHLFTNNSRNRNNPYWIPLEVNIYSDPDTDESPGHKYNSIIYNRGTKEYYESNTDYNGNPKGRINSSRKNKETSFGQFPLWQTSPNKRFYDHDNTGGLRDGGLNDRRVQRPHGYNMAALRGKSSY